MAHLTDNYTSEAPLSPAVREAISAAFEQGWADPKKLSQASGRTAILVEAAKEEISAALHTEPSRLEVLGEPSLAHFIALSGFLTEKSALVTSTIDLGKIRAVARAHSGEVREAGVDDRGQILKAGLQLSGRTVFSLQGVNGETGISQEIDHWRQAPGRVVVDATRALPGPDFCTGFSATTFDAASWAGPSGVGFIAISDREKFKYPLPHIAPIRSPGSYSIPLLLGSAIAITESLAHRAAIVDTRNAFARTIAAHPEFTLLGDTNARDSRHLSLLVDGISAEEFLRALIAKNIVVDAGSACSPEDLAPSHVIASMGYPTTGHIRISIHDEMDEEKITTLFARMREILQEVKS